MKSFEELRIVFFGTPEFAVASLDAMVSAGANVVAVVTAPDKPAGRGMQLHESAVKQYAVSKNIPVLQPVKLKAQEFAEELRALHADLQIVVAFRMLPLQIWSMPPLGTMNVHASLLPQYRGAAPINWAIMNGETETGVSTFKLKHEIDTGNILLQTKIPILPEDNAGTMYEKQMKAGAELLVQTIKAMTTGNLKEIAQDSVAESDIKHAPKLFKESMKIDWSRTAEEIHNHIRGLSPYPAAWTVMKDKTLKIFQCHAVQSAHSAEPGSFDTDHKTYLRFATPDGWLYADELQIEGKKKMGVEEFLRGFRA